MRPLTRRALEESGITLRFYACTLPLTDPIPVGSQVWNERPLVLIQAIDRDGFTGWGEASPLDGYGPDSLMDVLDAIGSDTSSPSLDFGLSCAVESCRSAHADESFLGRFGAPHQRQIGIARFGASATSDSLSATESSKDRFTVKLKIGAASAEEDAETVARVLDTSPNAVVRLDANARLTRSEALERAESLMPFADRIEFVEEPWQGCFESDERAAYPFKMAIDESLNDPEQSPSNWHHADVCVVKPALTGSIDQIFSNIHSYQEAEKAVVISSAWESGIGFSALCHIAARLDGLDHGLGTYSRIKADVWPLLATRFDATIDLDDIPSRPGEGLDLSPAMMHRLKARGVSVAELTL